MAKHTVTHELIRDEQGLVRGMHVRLAPGHAVRAIQPNPDCLVYFYLGVDGWPVGLKFLEPVEGVAASCLFTKLISSPNGAPLAVGQEVAHRFWTLPQLQALLDAMKQAERFRSLDDAIS